MNTTNSTVVARDFAGYASDPPRAVWPGGARVAVSLVLNIEEGAERSIARGDGADDAPPRWSSHATDPLQRNLDLESTFEYGARAGVWRVLEILRRHSVPATAFACAVALEANPRVARALVADGHEIANHGYRWDEHARLTDAEEGELIARSTASLLASTGQRPRCWYSRDGVRDSTRALLREAGYTYDSNSFSDDLPYLADGDGDGDMPPHVVVPYAGDTNDSGLGGAFRTGRAFGRYLQDSLDMLLEDPRAGDRMMSVGLHPRIIGRPAYAGALDRFLTYARAKPGVWFAARGEIARRWTTAHGDAAPHPS